MLFTNKKEATLLLVLAVALGIFLVAGGGTLAAGHSPKLMSAVAPLAANPGIDAACQPALDAGDKLFTTPYHMFGTYSGAMVGNQKPMSTEMILAGGVQYVLMNGKWSPSPLTLQESKDLVESDKKTAKTSCHYVRDDSVNGESAAVYSTHDITPHGTVDSQVWVSRRRGLILRQEIDIDTGNGNKSHTSARFEYSNVHAPTL